jgi:ATP synthase I chain
MPSGSPMDHLRTILASAALLGLGAAGIGALAGGPSFGIGVAAAGGLACADFWWLGRRVRALAAAPTRPSTLLLGLLSSLRLVAILAVAWLLLQRFPPLSLLVGFSSVVSAILLRAVASALQGAGHPVLE